MSANENSFILFNFHSFFVIPFVILVLATPGSVKDILDKAFNTI